MQRQRETRVPRSGVADYLERHHYEDGLDELAAQWLSGWDIAAAVKRGEIPDPRRRRIAFSRAPTP